MSPLGNIGRRIRERSYCWGPASGQRSPTSWLADRRSVSGKHDLNEYVINLDQHGRTKFPGLTLTEYRERQILNAWELADTANMLTTAGTLWDDHHPIVDRRRSSWQGFHRAVYKARATPDAFLRMMIWPRQSQALAAKCFGLP